MDRTKGETFTFRFTTRAFATGIPTALAGSPVLSAMEDAVDTPFTTGVSLTASAVAGLNLCTIDSSQADFEAGKEYDVYLSAGTVGGVSVVGEVVGHFSLSRSAAAVDLANATDGLGALSTDIGTAQADLDLITDTDGVILGAAGVDLIWDEELTGATHSVATSAGRRLRQLEASFVISADTAQAGAAGTITLAAAESATDEIFAGDRCIIVAGTGIGEHGIITAYNGTSKVATMSQNWVITPDVTSEYELSPADVDVETWQHVTVKNSATTVLPKVDTQSINDATVVGDGNATPWDGA